MRSISQAINIGSLKRVKHLVESNKILLEKHDLNGYTPLIMAVRARQSKIAEFIIAQPYIKAWINLQDAVGRKSAKEKRFVSLQHGRTAAHYAAVQRDSDIYDTLMKAGASASVADMVN